MEVLRHFSHVHPLVFNDERNHESGEVFCCACGELVSGPRFSCMECEFHLDKNCAEAPVEMDHPFHRKHNLKLTASSPYVEVNPICGFCNKKCEKFIYYCSCNLFFHIKCAFLSYKILEKKFRELVRRDALVSSECQPQELERVQCFACQKSLLQSDYISHDSRFYLHKKCFELPLEINHLSHRCHSLFLQFNSDHLPCKICFETQNRGLFYCCSICKFSLHIECVSPPPIVEEPSSHEHPFTRWLRASPFNCDACGTLGNYVSYICSTCNLMVHKECISLPRIIKNVWHEHPISHKYFVIDNECKTQDCTICHEEVNMACGSYYCSECKFIVHVNCALQEAGWYYKIDSKDDFDKLNAMLEASTLDPNFLVTKMIKDGENVINTEIKHFSHHHNLVLSDEVKDRMYCDGCSQIILTPFYGCLECGFSLHRSCAELPKKKQVLGHIHQHPFNLIFPNCIFKCAFCLICCTGFAYVCKDHSCSDHYCVRCADILWYRESRGHEHLLALHPRHITNWQNDYFCNACGGSTDGFSVYRCKACNFNVHYEVCSQLPEIVWDKADEHCLVLTYTEDNDHSEHPYCDICERGRTPHTWFYHCANCGTAVHIPCALGDQTMPSSTHSIGDAESKYTIHWRCSTIFIRALKGRIKEVVDDDDDHI
ncbi:hypothetical protein ES319_A10G231800v1 [Gossypium barbadense]|uniref:Phorbol-ester/DAG-type domain-containing protein n=1 Tax=Gossypium barbadense TaxID=3634 RepID=A0A5J5UAZ4_GOSBA|nr:hypothetical protein ES319_A10G231800v1 [Gossypium barbadense]